MASTFPRARKLGYDIAQVEDFLEEARRAYMADPRQPGVLDAASIRSMAFAMQRGGYSTNHVDAALERLEDAFAQRERERFLAESGDAAWYAKARASAQVVLDRLSRPEGQRFTRTNLFTEGYDVKEVDAFADRLVAYFQQGKAMTIDQVRTVAFRSRKRGYSEAQVDAVLDAVVDIMLAVR
ncbi:MAG TPA: DivIVA domain-containing protein [Rhodoglobus sp.]|nr:DivIVA domain-containing protein [Rhodoglobus sp.]